MNLMFSSTVEAGTILSDLQQASETSDRALLFELAAHDHPQVRQEVADNLNAPVELLRLLVNDEDFDVVFAVAEHPRTPSDVLRFLSGYHSDQQIRAVATESLNRLKNGEITAEIYVNGDAQEAGSSNIRQFKHGSLATYEKHKCRCVDCVTAYNEYKTAYREKRKVYLAANVGNPPKHGTANGYQKYKCRCDACVQAMREKEKKGRKTKNLRRRARETI